jgi:replicative DNA helicase
MIYNLEAEQYFIGAILLEPELAKEKTVQAEMFTDRHRIIMQAIERCLAKEITPDLVAIATDLQSGIENVGGFTYLSELAGAIPTTANLKHYERFIIDSYKVRKAYESATAFVMDATGNPDPILINKLAQEITAIQESHAVQNKKSWRDGLVDLVDQAFTERQGMTGIDTGFGELNRMTDGLQGNNLIILGARPSMGKTAFALNLGSNACALQDARVDIFSLETPFDRLQKRIISATGNINAEYMKRMEFPNDKVRNDFMQAVGLVDAYDINIHDKSSVTVEEIRSIVAEGNRQAKKEGKKHLVIIDYLQLINYVGPITGYVQQIGHISRSLKVMASDFDIPVVALSQLSRGVEQRQDKRPMMSDIRESGNIEQDADLIAFLYRDDYYDKESENKNITEVIIAKNRDGAVGTINLAFIKEYNKFVNLETRYDQAS